MSGGGGGVNEIQSTVKGAKARDAQSWHGAGKELVGGGASSPWQSLPIREQGPHLNDS